jgi:hypothetical protein
MRARSIKPGLFKNEILGKADPLLTILFEGLWCMADREGRLEDRPLRICAEVFPYRRKITEKKADQMLWWLAEHNFIARYEISGERFIQVVAFSEHQNPHKNEAPSRIQPLSVGLHRTRTVRAPESDEPKTERLGLTPSSLTPDSLTPDSGLLTPDPPPQPPSRGAGVGAGRGIEGNALAGSDEWRGVTECDPQAYEAWLEYRDERGDPVPPHVRIQHAKWLGGKGSAETQRALVDTCIRLEFKRLHDPIEHGRGHGGNASGNGRKPYIPAPTAAQMEREIAQGLRNAEGTWIGPQREAS